MAVCRADGRIREVGRMADVLNEGQKIADAPIEQKLQNVLAMSIVLPSPYATERRAIIKCF